MPSLPKPTKKDRLLLKKSVHEALVAYRHEQVSLAIFRDNDQCAMHYFLYGKNRRREEVHHVHGRGKAAHSWREHHTHLLCLCKECHDKVKAIYTPGGSAHMGWVEDLLKRANTEPINPEYRSAELG